MLGEGILIWRAWAVWGRDYRVIVVPVILMATAYCEPLNIISLNIL
jgi:hypothetical protein